MRSDIGVRLKSAPRIVLFSKTSQAQMNAVLSDIKNWKVRSESDLTKRLLNAKGSDGFFWSIGFSETREAHFDICADGGRVLIKEMM